MKLEKFKQRDPKKIGITIFTVACILLIAGVFFYTSFASFEVKEDFLCTLKCPDMTLLLFHICNEYCLTS